MLLLAFLPGLLLVQDAPAALQGAPHSSSLVWVKSLGLELHFVADGFSLLFALLVCVIGCAVLLYAADYLGKDERSGRFYSFLLLFAGAMLGFVLCDNLIAMFAFWELTSIASFLLIGFWDTRQAAQDGAVKALLITIAGGLGLLLAVVLLIQTGGSINLSGLDVEAVRQSGNFVPIMLLVIFAAMTKSAQFPFHLWLPTAMEAPTPISAYLHSATMVKAGIVLLAKFAPLYLGSSWSTVLLYIGLITMVWGSYFALKQRDLKALLAFSTVSQLGILVALYGVGDAYAATAHLINHAAFKAALFLVVGIIDHETGSRDVRLLSGLRRKLPWTFVIALPAALSMAGLPPLGGFISKELFYESMLHAGALPLLLSVLGSAMTFAYSFKFLRVFFGPWRSEKAHVHEAPPLLLAPPALLSALALLFGIFPWHSTLATPLVGLAGSSLGFEAKALTLWHGVTPALLYTLATWGVGLLLITFWRRFATLQERLTPRFTTNDLYYWGLGGLERGAATITRHTQHSTLSTQLRLLLLPASIVGFSFAVGALRHYLPATLSPIPLEFWAPSLMILASCYGVLNARTRLTALIFTGISGLALVILFASLRAPDLALTQLLIETVTVILFLAVFRYLPKLTRYERPKRTSAFDAVLAGGVGLSVFGVLLAVQTPLAARISDFYLRLSKEQGGGYNVVNVILVDFRGYDTLGEITVLAIVAIAVVALLKVRTRSVERPREVQDGPS